MPQNKKKQAEKTQQQEGIKYLGCFCRGTFSNFIISFVPVVKRKKRLNNSGYPEKGHHTCNKHEHLPLSYFSTCKMAFRKNDADNQKDDGFHHLKKL
jgi:hypothetical protein